MRLSRTLGSAVLFALLSSTPISAKDNDPKPCTIKSPTTGSYYDLSSMSVLKPKEDKKSRDDKTESWHARGYDYGSNFTINICAPVIEDLEHVKGVDAKLYKNVSAFYKKDDTVYSLGSVSTEPIFRGRKLVLNYTDGSPCPTQDDSLLMPRELIKGPDRGKDKEGKDKDGKKHKDEDDDDDDDDKHDKDKDSKKKKPSHDMRRKSTIISFLCDRDPSALKAAISFVGTTDHCTYMFEARSPAACGGASQAHDAGSVGPGGVFGIIALIAVGAYILGGIAYQRTVMHQRGWKQLPNYTTWAAIGNFIQDFFIIVFSSCSQWIPGRRGGYNQLPTYNDRSQFSRNEDENRLIDQLDEEWEE